MSDSSTDRFVPFRFKTRHLVLLVELGRHRSIMHAAEAANLTQPAASKLLAELEQTLGVRLFERGARGVTPTWYGRIMIRRAGAALAQMGAAHREIDDLLAGSSGRVAIGAVLAPATRRVSSAVTALKAKTSRLQVSICVDGSKPLVDRLRAGELDIAVARMVDTAAVGELHFEPVTDEPHGLVVRAGHPLRRHDPLRALALDQLARHTWIVPPAGSVLRDKLAAMFAAHGLAEPVDTVSVMSMPTIINLLLITDMVAPLAVELVQPHIDAGLLAVLPFDLDVRMDVYGIITRRHHRLSPGAEAMLQTLRELAPTYSQTV